MGSFETMPPELFGNIDSSFLKKSIEELEPASPLTIQEDSSLLEALETLKGMHLGSLLVVNADGKLTGIFTERDVLTKVILTDLDLDATPVSDFMTANPIAETMETTIAVALHRMSKGGFRHIPLVNSDKEPVGIISVKDILDFIALELMRGMLQARS